MFTDVVANAAALLLECAPFVLAGAVLSRVRFHNAPHAMAYFGCGCGTGPSARSLPAFAATWLAFGPLVASVRFAAAIAVARVLQRRTCAHAASESLAQFAAIAPFAIAGAVLAPAVPAIAGAHSSPAAIAIAGAFAAFVTSPCAIGAAGTAAMLRAHAPAAAIGFLSVAGIADLRVWIQAGEDRTPHDCLAYALAAFACAAAAMRGGGSLVNPRFVPALWICAAAFAYFGFRYRTRARPSLRIAPAIMLAGCFLAAPAPAAVQTETTLAAAYPGQRIDFTGELVRTPRTASLVRYAITCCRADAAPVVLQLDSLPAMRSKWAHARGVIVRAGNSLRLHPEVLQAVPAPPDPFVYR